MPMLRQLPNIRHLPKPGRPRHDRDRATMLSGHSPGRCRSSMPRKIEKQVALDRALTLFWDHGYRGTSMDMLTTAVGVEKPSIYASFGSKNKLYLTALTHYRKWLIGFVRNSISSAP